MEDATKKTYYFIVFCLADREVIHVEEDVPKDRPFGPEAAKPYATAEHPQCNSVVMEHRYEVGEHIPRRG